MDEVTDPSLSVLAEGSFLGGPKSHICDSREINGEAVYL